MLFSITTFCLSVKRLSGYICLLFLFCINFFCKDGFWRFSVTYTYEIACFVHWLLVFSSYFHKFHFIVNFSRLILKSKLVFFLSEDFLLPTLLLLKIFWPACYLPNLLVLIVIMVNRGRRKFKNQIFATLWKNELNLELMHAMKYGMYLTFNMHPHCVKLVNYENFDVDSITWWKFQS